MTYKLRVAQIYLKIKSKDVNSYYLPPGQATVQNCLRCCRSGLYFSGEALKKIQKPLLLGAVQPRPADEYFLLHAA